MYDFALSARELLDSHPLPSKGDFTQTWWYSKGRVVAEMAVDDIEPTTYFTSEDILQYQLCDFTVEELDSKGFLKEEIVINASEYLSQLNTARICREKIIEHFEFDLSRFLGFKRTHPKWCVLMKLAKEYAGSSTDFQSIAEEANRLSLLLL